MKKSIVMLFAVLGLSAVSSAAVVQCTPTSSNLVADGINLGSQIYDCGPIGSADGLNVDSIRIFTSTETSVTGQTAGTTYGLVFTMANSAGYNNEAPFTRTCVASLITGSCGVGPTDSPGAFTNILDVDVLPSFTVTITASNIIGGTIVGATNGIVPDSTAVAGIASVFVEYNEVGSQVPEPSTFALLGAALAGLGVYSRRRKA